MDATAKRPRIHVAADDPSLTPHAGLLHVGELVGRTGLVGLIDRRLSGLKERDRGLSPGALLVSVAESLLPGGDCLSDLEVLRRDQLALEGKLTTVYAYSFIVTDLEGDATEIEWFHRQRAGAEELFKDAKLGVGMRHMPMGDPRANAAWMHACLLALALSSMLSQVAGLPSRPQGKRLRRELVRVPGRIVRTGRRVMLRLPAACPTAAFFIGLYAALRALSPPG